jgi:hypothetical protein
VARIAAMVAPVFNSNPRRIKLFMNSFRLMVLIARVKDMFRDPGPESPFSQLSVYQLAKFVAIRIRWPRLIAEVGRNPKLIRNLQLAALGRSHEKSVEVTFWQAEPSLMWLLRFGIPISQTEDQPKIASNRERLYTVEGLDVEMLLRISPNREDASYSTYDEMKVKL